MSDKRIDGQNRKELEELLTIIGPSGDIEKLYVAIRQIADVLSSYTNAEEMTIIEFLLTTHYRMFQESALKDEAFTREEADLLLVKLLALRLNVNVLPALIKTPMLIEVKDLRNTAK